MPTGDRTRTGHVTEPHQERALIAMNTGIEQETAHIDTYRKHQRSRRHNLTLRHMSAVHTLPAAKVYVRTYQYGFGDGSGNVSSIQGVM